MEIFGTYELWDRLKNKNKPLLVYGMGNGADKILSALDVIGVACDGFFASDEFVRGHFFHGMKVMTYAEACEKFGDFIVLIAFGSSLDGVMANMKKIAAEKETYAPDVPVASSELFDAAFFLKNKDKIDAARELFADEMSVSVYDEIIKYKLDGDISHFKIDTPESEAFASLLSGGYGAYIDLGAYNGDTISKILGYFPTVKKITAFEPSERIFKKLTENVPSQGADVRLYNMAAWNASADAVFIDGEGRNSQLASDASLYAHDGRKKAVKLAAPDDVCDYKGEKLLIKLDVEGSEAAALEGSRRLIAANDTELIVSAYHRSEDIFSLPITINKMLPHHKIYLRKHPYIPAWDVNIYVKR
ncbi:MAG: FkbM family methyltransferase [Clostridia bacterium]|nr:FkbM family methyltransferase [Clostridia bacterium]